MNSVNKYSISGGAFVLLLCLLVCACVTDKTDDKTETQEVTGFKAHNNIQEDEDFDLFISRFYTDTLFTKERIYHNVEGYSGEDSEECYEESSKWNNKLLLLYVMDAAEAKNKEEFLTKYKKTDEDRIEEEIYIPDSDCFYFSVYKLINHKWYLCSFVVNNL